MTNQEFTPVRPEDFDGAFKRIGKDWMLISASDGERTNTMTASWGCIGVLWHKPVAVCFIRPTRYTHSITEESDHLSLAFFEGEEYRTALTYCGRNSGRDGDKFAASGLTPLFTEDGVPYPAEATRVLICRKLYTDEIKENGFVDPSLLSNYAAKDFHKIYVGEIVQYIKKAVPGL